LTFLPSGASTTSCAFSFVAFEDEDKSESPYYTSVTFEDKVESESPLVCFYLIHPLILLVCVAFDNDADLSSPLTFLLYCTATAYRIFSSVAFNDGAEMVLPCLLR
jgi:hypothetical protein